MEMLVNFVIFAFAFSTLKQTIHANNNCVELKFLNQENDFPCLQVNQDISITFAIFWVHCSLTSSEHLIKVLANNSSHADECRLSVTNSTCNVSDNTPWCWCMSPRGPVTFTERFTHAANITYVLKWYHGQEDKEEAVTVRVFKVSPTCDDSPPPSFALPGVVSGCAVLAVVGILVVGFFVGKKVKGSSNLRSLHQDDRTHATGDCLSQNRTDGKCHVTQYEDVWDAVNSQSHAARTHVTWRVDLTKLETNIYSNSYR